MKRYTRLILISILALGPQLFSWGDSHKKSLDDIIDGFSAKDTAEQYEARRELATYVANGTAPDKKNGAEKVTKELLGFLKSRKVDHEAKKYIIRDLARVGTGTAVSPLSKIMSGNDALLAEAARQALEQIPDKKATAALEKAIAGAKNDADRQKLLRTLANRSDSSTLPYFTDRLESDDSLVALESIYALTRMGNGKATQVLEKAYLSNPAPELKLELERSLVALQGTSGEALVQIQKNGINASNRQAALRRLVSGGHPEAANLLKASLLSANADLRATAIRTALANGKQSFVRNLLDRFPNEDLRVVLGGLSAFEGKGAESLALKVAQEGDVEVQVQAMRALAAYGSNNKTVNFVLWHFSGKDKELKQAATYALERMPGPVMDNRLGKMLNSEEEEEVLVAIEALAHRSIPNAKNRLIRLVSVENPKLAREALRTLSVIADEEDLYRLYFLTKRSDEGLATLISGMLKKVAPEVGSLELQAKVKAL